jgi:ribosomal protein S18 acetylase RimI-like enzyme
MLIRRASTSDILILCDLYTKFYKHNSSQQPEFCLPAVETGGYPNGVICGNTGVIFVAEDDSRLCGFIHAEIDNTPPYPSVAQHRFVSVVDLYVEPDCRRRGIATELVNSVKTWAKQSGAEYLELFVLNENAEGLEFYKKQRFEIATLTMRCKL